MEENYEEYGKKLAALLCSKLEELGPGVVWGCSWEANRWEEGYITIIGVYSPTDYDQRWGISVDLLDDVGLDYAAKVHVDLFKTALGRALVERK